MHTYLVSTKLTIILRIQTYHFIGLLYFGCVKSWSFLRIKLVYLNEKPCTRHNNREISFKTVLPSALTKKRGFIFSRAFHLYLLIYALWNVFFPLRILTPFISCSAVIV